MSYIHLTQHLGYNASPKLVDFLDFSKKALSKRTLVKFQENFRHRWNNLNKPKAFISKYTSKLKQHNIQTISS